MMARWRELAVKFDALSVRERAMVVGGISVVAIALFDFAVLQPLEAKQKRLVRQIEETRTAVRTADTAIRVMEGEDASAAKRKYREQLKQQIAEIDGKLQGLQRNLVPPDQMAKLLEGMLARSRGLTLVSLQKLPAQRFDAAGPAPTTGAPAAPQPAERGIYQHSFELTVQGSYSDMHDYLARLEKLPWQMFWGRAKLNADEYPRLTLTLTLHTLSLNKAWLIV